MAIDPRISISGELIANAATSRRFARNSRRAAARKRSNFPVLHAERLDDAVARNRFVKNVLDFGELVLSAPRRCAHLPADFFGRIQNHGQEQQQHPRQLSA